MTVYLPPLCFFLSVEEWVSSHQDLGWLLLLCVWSAWPHSHPRQELCSDGAGHVHCHQVSLSELIWSSLTQHYLSLFFCNYLNLYYKINCICCHLCCAFFLCNMMLRCLPRDFPATGLKSIHCSSFASDVTVLCTTSLWFSWHFYFTSPSSTTETLYYITAQSIYRVSEYGSTIICEVTILLSNCTFSVRSYIVDQM